MTLLKIIETFHPSAIGRPTALKKDFKMQSINDLKSLFQDIQLPRKDRKYTNFPLLAQKLIIFAD